MLVDQGYNCTNMRRYCTFMLVKGNIIHSANEKNNIYVYIIKAIMLQTACLTVRRNNELYQL